MVLFISWAKCQLSISNSKIFNNSKKKHKTGKKDTHFVDSVLIEPVTTITNANKIW